MYCHLGEIDWNQPTPAYKKDVFRSTTHGPLWGYIKVIL